jgi:hypothetical protein
MTIEELAAYLSVAVGTLYEPAEDQIKDAEVVVSGKYDGNPTGR